VKKFDNIYEKEITKRYDKHELQRLSFKRIVVGKRKFGAGFKSNPMGIDVLSP
jgi:hypothetical protein